MSSRIPLDDAILSTPLSAPSPPRRLHGLDWLRAGATLLVVALHAGIAYLVAPMPGLVWATSDAVGSLSVDALTWWINGFIMPLYFVLSGFVACGLMARRGVVAFADHRSRRLLGPFLLSCVLILPLDLYTWLLGWVASGRIPLRKLQSLKVGSPLSDGLWGVSHLWFLQYLWLFCMGAAAVCWVADWQRRKKGQCRERYSVLRTRYSGDLVAILLGVAAFALWWDPQLVIGFRHSWTPLPANLLFYAAWFIIGWRTALKAHGPRLAFTAPDLDGSTRSHVSSIRSHRSPWRHGELRLVLALVVFAVLWPLIHQHVETPLIGDARIVLVVLFVVHAWLAVTGLFGVCLRRLDRKPPPIVKYLASASFWIYLFHHPVVALAQVSFGSATMPVVVKFAISLLAGITLPLLTYEAFVRRSWIGVVLSGRRDIHPPATEQATTPLPVPTVEPSRKAA